MFTRLRMWWHLRCTPVSELKLLNNLLANSGRRVTYDLKHSVDTIYTLIQYLKRYNVTASRAFESELEIFRTRADHWLSVFNPASEGKSYNTTFNRMIQDLEKEVERLETLCIENNIDPTDKTKSPL